ncbi:MAG: HepT-like ribonuclease domain-containing protein [Pirellulales bacterium]
MSSDLQIRGIRNRIIHGYDQINWRTIWNVVTIELPPLIPLLEQIDRETVD